MLQQVGSHITRAIYPLGLVILSRSMSESALLDLLKLSMTSVCKSHFQSRGAESAGGLSMSLLVLNVTKSSILANPKLPNSVGWNGLTPTFYSFSVFKKQIFANYESQPKLARYSEIKQVSHPIILLCECRPILRDLITKFHHTTLTTQVCNKHLLLAAHPN